MAEKKEQVRPLTAASFEIKINEDEDISTEFKRHHHKKCLTCCGCVTAIFLIIAAIFLVLVFTVFHVKDPVIKMHDIKIEGFDTFVRTSDSLPNKINVTVEADVSVKNRNFASFKFSNTTTSLYYDGGVIGEAEIPAGEARARRTLDMSVLIDVMVDKLLAAPSLKIDLTSGKLPISTSTRVSGKVKMIKIIKKHVVLHLNCTMSVNVITQAIQDQNCKKQLSL